MDQGFEQSRIDAEDTNSTNAHAPRYEKGWGGSLCDTHQASIVEEDITDKMREHKYNDSAVCCDGMKRTWQRRTSHC